MAIVTKFQPPPPPPQPVQSPPPVFRLELSALEAGALSRLLERGVAMHTINKLNLRELTDELRRAGVYAEDFGTCANPDTRFASVAVLGDALLTQVTTF